MLENFRSATLFFPGKFFRLCYLGQADECEFSESVEQATLGVFPQGVQQVFHISASVQHL